MDRVVSRVPPSRAPQSIDARALVAGRQEGTRNVAETKLLTFSRRTNAWLTTLASSTATGGAST
jgi:hypothetical protein